MSNTKEINPHISYAKRRLFTSDETGMEGRRLRKFMTDGKPGELRLGHLSYSF